MHFPFRRRPSAVHRLFTDAHDPLPATTDLLGFSFAWELDYTNLLRCLQLLGRHAADGEACC